MLKFSNIVKVVKEFLETQNFNNSHTVTIEEGKYGELPSITPAVWIYAEPERSFITALGDKPVSKRAKLTFFAVEQAADNKTSAINKSVELIETVEELIFSDQFLNFLNNHPYNFNQQETDVNYTDSEKPLNFDAVYSDLAVSYLEVWINYA